MTVRLMILAICALSVLACKRRAPAAEHEHHLSPLAAPPDWSHIDQFQESITRAELVRLLRDVYSLANDDAYKRVITVTNTQAIVHTSARHPERTYVLRLAASPRGAGARASRAQAGQGTDPDRRPALAGLRVAIDPGHIGGRWSDRESRALRIGRGRAIAEGDENLIVAQHLARNLAAHGAHVTLVRSMARPVGQAQPGMLEPLARQLVRAQSIQEGRALDAAQEAKLVRRESLRLAYRTSEIHARARVVNQDIQPDVTLCVHFDAQAWSDPANPSYATTNHLHVLVHGAYTEDELAYDDMRFAMLAKLLSRDHEIELGLARAVTDALVEATGLPAADYPDRAAARRISQDGYIWARNLLANRLYRGPVIYLEPYVMNHPEVHERLQAGDYAGLRMVAGKLRPSIHREYADAVTRGLLNYYRAQR